MPLRRNPAVAGRFEASRGKDTCLSQWRDSQDFNVKEYSSFAWRNEPGRRNSCTNSSTARQRSRIRPKRQPHDENCLSRHSTDWFQRRCRHRDDPPFGQQVGRRNLSVPPQDIEVSTFNAAKPFRPAKGRGSFTFATGETLTTRQRTGRVSPGTPLGETSPNIRPAT